MAHLHFKRTVYKAGSAKASGRIEYITGQALPHGRKARHQLNSLRDGREDLVAHGTRNLPEWAEGNPHMYFQAAECYEAKAAVSWTAFEEWTISVPQELSREQNLALVDDLLDVIAGRSLPATYGFHDPKTLDGTASQPHIHLLISARMHDEYPRTPEQHFKRWNARDPASGGARKDPTFWHYGAVYAHRLMISDVLNVHLEYHGMRARVHPESLKSRGIERGPEPKLLPSDSAKYRKTHALSKTMLEVFRMRTARLDTRGTEDTNARQYWQQRKASLGITGEMSREERMVRLVTLRHGLRGEASRVRHTHEQGQAVGARLTRLTHLVSQRGLREGQAQEAGVPRGPALRVRLHEEARGLSY